MPTYTVTLRYSMPPHDTPQEATLSGIHADTPEEAGWMAKVQLRLAHKGKRVGVSHLGVKEEPGSE